MAKQLAAAAAVLAVAAIGWLLLGDRTSVDVTVVFDAQPVRCDGTTIRLDEQDDGFRQHIVELRPEMDCRLRFFVANNGSDSITVERIEFPFLGPDAGSGALAHALNPTYNSADPVAPALDAGWIVNDVVEAQQRIFYEAFVVHDPNDCQSAGVLSFDFPVVTLADGTALDEPPRVVGFAGVGFNDC